MKWEKVHGEVCVPAHSRSLINTGLINPSFLEPVTSEEQRLPPPPRMHPRLSGIYLFSVGLARSHAQQYLLHQSQASSAQSLLCPWGFDSAWHTVGAQTILTARTDEQRNERTNDACRAVHAGTYLA